MEVCMQKERMKGELFGELWGMKGKFWKLGGNFLLKSRKIEPFLRKFWPQNWKFSKVCKMKGSNSCWIAFDERNKMCKWEVEVSRRRFVKTSEEVCMCDSFSNWHANQSCFDVVFAPVNPVFCQNLKNVLRVGTARRDGCEFHNRGENRFLRVWWVMKFGRILYFEWMRGRVYERLTKVSMCDERRLSGVYVGMVKNVWKNWNSENGWMEVWVANDEKSWKMAIFGQSIENWKANNFFWNFIEGWKSEIVVFGEIIAFLWFFGVPASVSEVISRDEY